MNIFFYIVIFIIGSLFGSFFSLAIYRIPNKQNIFYKSSYCPNCNKKLGFFEMIPILSYIALGGKCRHCKQKIGIRYILSELLGGITFVAYALALKLDIYHLNISNLIFFGFTILYLAGLFIIAGIDKKSRKIEKSILYYEIIIAIVYMIYLFIVEGVDMYKYIIYLGLLVILLIIDNITLKKFAKNSYVNNMLMLVIIMAIFTEEFVTINTVVVLLMAIAIYLIINKIKMKTKRNIKQEKIISRDMNLAFFLCCINIIVFLGTLLMI